MAEYVEIQPGEDDDRRRNQRWIVIAVVAVVVLCCCLVGIVIAAWLGGDAVLKFLQGLSAIKGFLAA